MKRTIKCTALLLALAPVLACAGCGKKRPAQPDEYGLAPEPSKLDGVAIGNDLEIVSTGRYAGLFVEDGTDETVSDVFCIRVKNTGEQDVQYAHITLSRSGGKQCIRHQHPACGTDGPGAGAEPPGSAGEAGGADRRRVAVRRVQRAAVPA